MSTPHALYENLGENITYLVLMSVLTLFGTLGNALIICAVFISKKLRTVGNMFIVNLALADLCLTTIVDPFAIVGFLEGETYFLERPALCEFIASTCLTGCFCSLLSIGAISINRYIHICHYAKYDVIFTKCKTLFILFLMWLFAFLAGLGCFFGWSDLSYDLKTRTCIYDRKVDRSFIFFAFAAVNMPLIVIIICYIRICVYILRSKKNVAREDIAKKPSIADMRFWKTILLVVFVYVGCWIPYDVVILYDTEDVLSKTLHSFTLMVAHTSSSVNFIIYGVSNAQFRHAYIQVFQFIDLRRLFVKHKPNTPHVVYCENTSGALPH